MRWVGQQSDAAYVEVPPPPLAPPPPRAEGDLKGKIVISALSWGNEQNVGFSVLP
jgi:hypothetical protein